MSRASPLVVAFLEPGLEKRATRLCSPDRHSKAPEERSAGPCTSAPGSSACVCGASLAPTPHGRWQAQIPAGHSSASCTMPMDGCHSAPLWQVRLTLLHYSQLSAARSKRQSAGRAGLLAASAATVTGIAYSHSPETLHLRRLWMADDACAVLLATVMIPPLTTGYAVACCWPACRCGPDLVGEPLTLGHRGRHPHSSQGRAAGRGKADTRMVLLRPASNHCILLCSPALLHLAAPVRPMTSGTARPRTAGVSLRGHSHPRRRSSTSNQKDTRGSTHASAEGASRRP
ncbi:Hypothetical protein GSB_150197 [Giardia duodenalis]|uniref:Uncharacterized protein n=1 Tax=Giardia intestinalis TaxID=5741 RepID=V6U2W9_GIAIN|nr:Hypothetical protein GSB_150197 [Giardia intestinalis]